jgi:hypothetical protein
MKLCWEPRVAPEKIRRLYQTDAQGILDEELLDDVAYALYARCDSIVAVTEAICQQRLRCPGCSQMIRLGDGQAELISCSGCRWEVTREAFRQSYRNKRLGGFGAIEAFRAYLQRFPGARSPQEKMLLIDRLIHAMHNELARRVQRPASVNLIEGDIRSVVALLEGLAYGEGSTLGVGSARSSWKRVREAQAAWGSRPGRRAPAASDQAAREPVR